MLALQVALSLAGLALTAAIVDVTEVRAALLQLSAGWLLLSLAMQLVQVLLVATRWYWINRQLGVSLPLRRALREYMVSASLNQLIPGGFAGDVVRGYRQARLSDSEQVTKVWLGVVVDRVAGQLGLWLLAGLSAPFWLPTAQAGRLELALGVMLLVLLGVGGATIFVARTRPRLSLALKELSRVMRSPWVVSGHIALSCSLLLAWSASFYCASRALSFSTRLIDVWRAAIPSVLASSIPGFVNGWGAREGAAALAYGWAGLSPTEGSTVSVTYGLVGLLLAALGLSLLLPRWSSEKNPLTNWSRNHAIIVLAATAVSLLFGSPWVLGLALFASFAHLVYDHRGAHTPLGTFGWANGVTGVRLGLVLVAVVGLVHGVSAIVIVSVAILALDAIDGWIARRTNSSSAFGELFDMETDAAFVLTMSWLLAVEREVGVWALIPGLWRYTYVLWETALPPRFGPAGRANFARYSFLVSVLLLIAALGSPDWLARAFAALAAALVSSSFLLAAYYAYFGGRETQARRDIESKPE